MAPILFSIILPIKFISYVELRLFNIKTILPRFFFSTQKHHKELDEAAEQLIRQVCQDFIETSAEKIRHFMQKLDEDTHTVIDFVSPEVMKEIEKELKILTRAAKASEKSKNALLKRSIPI